MKASMLFKQMAIGVGLSAVLVGTAMAAPIASFDYTQEFEFTSSNPSGVIESGVTDDDSLTNNTSSTADDSSNIDGNTKLQWGNDIGNGQSSLVVNPEAGDSESASGDLNNGNVLVSEDVNATMFSLGPVIVHNNFTVGLDNTVLQSATAQDYVVLDPSPADGGLAEEQTVEFGILFEETVNSLTGAACPSGIENAAGCGDIFVLSGGLLGLPTIFNFGADIAFLVDSFIRDGYLYEVFLKEETGQLTGLSTQACEAAGAEAGCIGFVTAEGLSNEIQLEFAILATEAVPEPATLALLAGSLLLMGLVRRKKVSSLSA
jgi:hypothetical protein